MLVDWRKLSVEEVAEKGREPRGHYDAMMELQGRQTKAQIEAAQYSKRAVWWMAASVVVLTLASIGSFVLDLLTFLRAAPS